MFGIEAKSKDLTGKESKPMYVQDGDKKETFGRDTGRNFAWGEDDKVKTVQIKR